MKILHITQAYYPAIAWGGPVVAVQTLSKELVRMGHTVSVYTTTIGLSENRTQTDTLDDVSVVYFKSRKLWRWHFPFAALKTLWQRVGDFDVIHVHSVWDPMIWLSGIILLAKKKRFIISPHGCIDPVLIQKRSVFIKKILYRLFVKKMFERASGFHFTSPYEEEKFIEFTGIHRPSQITANGLDTTIFTEMVSAEELAPWNLTQKDFFLFLGRINWKKGLEVLIEAFASVQSKLPGLLLVIAGPDENNFKKSIETMVANRGIGSCVMFTGLVSGKKKVALLRYAKAFFLPSYSENFGIAVAEALAAGTPVVVSHGVGIASLVEQYNAGIVVDMEARSLSNAMSAIIANEEARIKQGQQGQRLVAEHFDPLRITQTMVDFYSRVSASH